MHEHFSREMRKKWNASIASNGNKKILRLVHIKIFISLNDHFSIILGLLSTQTLNSESLDWGIFQTTFESTFLKKKKSDLLFECTLLFNVQVHITQTIKDNGHITRQFLPAICCFLYWKAASVGSGSSPLINDTLTRWIGSSLFDPCSKQQKRPWAGHLA